MKFGGKRKVLKEDHQSLCIKTCLTFLIYICGIVFNRQKNGKNNIFISRKDEPCV